MIKQETYKYQHYHPLMILEQIILTVLYLLEINLVVVAAGLSLLQEL